MLFLWKCCPPGCAESQKLNLRVTADILPWSGCRHPGESGHSAFCTLHSALCTLHSAYSSQHCHPEAGWSVFRRGERKTGLGLRFVTAKVLGVQQLQQLQQLRYCFASLPAFLPVSPTSLCSICSAPLRTASPMSQAYDAGA
jgi:hypothetical protein